MDNIPKPIISPGSMLNSSEGLLSAGGLAALTASLSSSSDWRVQAASAIGISILASVYVWARSRVKASEAGME